VRRPLGILFDDVDVDAHVAFLPQRDLLDGADGKAGKGEVHPGDDALGVVCEQHQVLLGVEVAARPHHEQPGGDDQGHGEGQ
jgi:hypothetical protein